MLIDTSDLTDLSDSDLWNAINSINREVIRRESWGVMTAVRRVYPDAVALVCDVEDPDDGSRTAAPDGVLLPNGQVEPLDHSNSLYHEVCDAVANLAEVHGAIVLVDDMWLIKFKNEQ